MMDQPRKFAQILLLSLAASALSACACQSFTNSVGMEFIYIPAGEFMMGCGEGDEKCKYDEKPRHRVKISRPFYLDKYEVTREDWIAVMGNDRWKGELIERNIPMTKISWDEAQKFISRLNEKEGTNKYRLPTEAEWEYAARAGTTSTYSFGDDTSQLKQYAHGGATHIYGGKLAVGQKKPNPWGLYDMHGNVWEWVSDWYKSNYYGRSPLSDPLGPVAGNDPIMSGDMIIETACRVRRGGSWEKLAGFLRSARRDCGYTHPDTGFRVARSLDDARSSLCGFQTTPK
jgi:formylglycine-generating enzyme required for sulfatase activity